MARGAGVNNRCQKTRTISPQSLTVFGEADSPPYRRLYRHVYDAIGSLSARERLGGSRGGRLVVASQRAGSPPESPARYGLGARRRAGQGSRPLVPWARARHRLSARVMDARALYVVTSP